ncbi:hypothetical protein MAPG_03570 [Magnaporthiopsis poae ATCC 64411]|uniref:Uncharacterized protein n=1 Tax=Magnaporthiopsis poae (strain ATCC 64411 / 73-15) TaxID=644358 RepID=A0A0C4DUD0_MAGP6|nr:hypothetical protein MAPG_03570 [Magnaporthiopsis poae ATCC 64411]
MASTMTMSSTSISFSRQPDVVADKVLRRAELGKMARRLQNSLALAKFKTTHGLEELTLDSLEPRFEEERRRRRMLAEGDMLSDSSSSSASDLPYYPTSSSSANRALTSSPLKATGPVFFSDAIGPSSGGGGSTGHHRKRTYMATFDGDSRQPPHYAMSSPSKRFRASPTPRRAAFNPAAAAVAAVGGGNLDLGYGGYGGGSTWRHHTNNQLAQSSPIKPRRQQHFTTSTGPDVSLFKGSHRISEALVVSSPPPMNYAANLSDDDDDLLPAHSFAPQHGGVDPDAFDDHSGAAATAAAMRSSPPQTPPMRNRSLARNRGGRNNKNGGGDDDGAQQDGASGNNGKTGEDAADLLLYLAASPSPATRSAARRAASNFSAAAAARMDPPSTPPPKMGGGGGSGGGGGGGMALPSSMMTTPGGGNPFPATPSFQTFDFADFVNITPSPAPVQRGFKTPVVLPGGANGTGTGRTPISETRRRLTFDEFP